VAVPFGMWSFSVGPRICGGTGAMPLAAEAGLVNGSFGAGLGSFTGWDRIGDTSIQGSGIGISPTDGRFMALLTKSPDWPREYKSRRCVRPAGIRSRTQQLCRTQEPYYRMATRYALLGVGFAGLVFYRRRNVS
jgi:hypothetical protein